MEKFRLQENASALYRYAHRYLLSEIPKTRAAYQIKLDTYLLNINENIFRANLSAGSIRIKYQKEILVNISMVDMILGGLLEFECVNKKKYMKFCNMLLELRKMITGWINEKKE